MSRLVNYNKNITPLLSVTMSAYNTALYIEECLDSLLQQSFTDFELIIVDDASSDGTLEVIENYSVNDSRIRFFPKEKNEGLAVARNDGIAAARGKYILFLDSDDLYHPDLLKLSYECAESSNADMILWDYVIFDDVSQIEEKQLNYSALCELDPSDRSLLLKQPAFAWTRLVRREVFNKLDIVFPRGLTYQDIIVHWQLCTQLDKITILPQRLAYYRQQPEATTAGKGIKRADYFAVLDLVEEYLTKENLLGDYEDVLTAQQLNAWHGVYDVIATEHKPLVIQMINDRFTLRHSAFINSKKTLRRQARLFYESRDGSRIATISLWVRNTLRAFYRILKQAR